MRPKARRRLNLTSRKLKARALTQSPERKTQRNRCLTTHPMAEENSKKFLIITSETGGGHTSAATAIADGLKRFAAPDCLVNIARAIEESHMLAEKLTELYNYLLRHHQHLMKYYYWAIERFRPNESNLLYRMTSRYVRQLFEKYCPQIVVSVHPMTQHFLGHMLRELGLLDRIPL